MQLAERLQAMVYKGFEPSLKTHIVPKKWAPEKFEGLWLAGTEDGHWIGWTIDAFRRGGAFSKDSGRHIFGAVFPTIEMALEYVEREIDKYEKVQ